ncbi:hypothetical protein [Geminisphaera colitermitum]|uniref:hypothetical protein n=1 Tax=Geminisphaera colitermitum TaxID=1148786 RepID=UPI0001964E45|nr:hypothetical protein [Geminisphaera colitermitum]
MLKVLAAIVALLQAIPALSRLVDQLCDAWKSAQAAKRRDAKKDANHEAVYGDKPPPPPSGN